MAKDKVEIDILAKTKKALVGIAGVTAALAGITAVLKKSVEAYEKQLKAETKLQAVLKATGNAAGYSFKQLKDMAAGYQNVTTFGDELIINSQAILATFKSISGDVFPRTLEAAMDLSAAFGTDLQQSTIMLGKALEDPITGMGALRRVGVSLDKATQDNVKSLVELGKTAEAQGIILEAVEGQVKGVAKAFGDTSIGQIEKFKNNMSDLMEGIGAAVMEGTAPFVEQANKFFQANKQKIVNILKNLPEIAMETFSVIGKIIESTFSWDTLSGLFGSVFTGMINQFKIVWKYFPQMAIKAIDVVTAPLQAIGEFLGSVFAKVWVKIKNAGVDALQGLVEPINKIIEALNFITGAEVGKNIISFDFLKEEEPKIKDFGEVWTRNMKEAGQSIEDLAALAGGYIGETTSNYSSMFSQIAELYKDDTAGYLERINTIINAESDKTEEILGMNQEIIEDNDIMTDEIKENAEELTKEYQKLAEEIINSVGGIVEAMVVARVEGENVWYAFKEAATDAIAAAVKALAKQWAVMAAAALVPGPTFNPAAAAGLTAASIAGYAAAGLIKSFAQGIDSYITSGPELIRVGDNPGGREKVTVEPLQGNQSTKRYILNIGGREFNAWLEEKIDDGDLRLERA